MEMIRYFQASEPNAFPFTAAIGAAVFATSGVMLDCFVLVENRGAFLGLKRRTLPQGATIDTALEEMMTGLDRIYQNMVRAADRHSALPAEAKSNTPLILRDKPHRLLQTLWNKRIFAPHLQWIAQKTISGILCSQVAGLANHENDERGLA